MDVRVYSILDNKSGMYGPLMSFVNDNTSIRSFQEMILSGDKNSLIALYPTDYSLYFIGSFDNATGLLQSSPAPMLIMTGLDACTHAIAENDRRLALQSRLKGIKEYQGSGLPDLTTANTSSDLDVHLNTANTLSNSDV